MSRRSPIAGHQSPVSGHVGTAFVTLLVRLGLSWLVGRRYLLLTTASADTEATRRTALSYVWREGNLRIRADSAAPWVHDLELNPVAMVQAAPGPLAVSAIFHDDGTISLPPTGRPSPAPVVPDLLWVYPAALVISGILVRGRRWRSP